MRQYLDARSNDMFSRFAVLHYLFAASLAEPWDLSGQGTPELGLNEAESAAMEDLQTSVRPLLADFAESLPPENIPAGEQAMWELKQAVIMSRWERLKRLATQYRKLTGQSPDESNLMLARALWLPNSGLWTSFILDVVSRGAEADALVWEDFIEQGTGDIIFLASCAPPEPSDPPISRECVIDAIACLSKVRTEARGPHWGILADCCAMAGEPGQCATIWMEHGPEILKPMADVTGRPVDVVLTLPDYQLRIADLWAQAGRTDKEIAVLGSLRQHQPRLQGVHRRLAECYCA